MKQTAKLSKAIIDKLDSNAHRVWDTEVPQLFIRVLPSRVKSWGVAWNRKANKVLGKWPGVTVDAARTKARNLLVEVDKHGAPVAVGGGPMTVGDACRDYVAALRKDGRKAAADDAERRFERTVFHDRIGKMELGKLSQDAVEAWRDRIESGELAALPVRKGRPPNAKPLSKATVNRMRTTLVAALNRAVSRRKVTQDRVIEWANVKPYAKVGNRRQLYLDRDQRRALLANAGADLRDVMECMALTGCRPGDPAAVLRRDYDARHATVTFRTKDHLRTVPLSPQAKTLFDRIAKGKLPAANLFTNSGAVWKPHDWRQLVKDAAAAASLPDGVVLYTLRHCWITDAITAGMSLLDVARISGTSLSMIDKHYGQLVLGAARDKLAEVNFL